MKTIENSIIKELKERLAAYLFNRQNHSCGNGYNEFYVQAYLDQIWQNMELDQKQKQCIETAYREMIIDGHLNPESVPIAEIEPDWKQENEIRLSLTDEGIFHYIYSYE